MNTGPDTPAFLTRLVTGRSAGEVRQVNVEGLNPRITLYRVSWTAVTAAGGSAAGCFRDRMVVQWHAYVDGEPAGSSPRKRSAVALAEHMLAVCRGLEQRGRPQAGPVTCLTRRSPATAAEEAAALNAQHVAEEATR